MVLNTPDMPLTETGRRQAQVTGSALRDRIFLPDIILVSPYARTRETLEHMIAGWPELATVKSCENDDLREQEAGQSAQYYDWRLFLTMHPEEDELRNESGPYHYRWPGGENVPDVCRRSGSVLNTLTTHYSGQKALLVSHHVPILALRVVLEGLSPEQFIYLDQNERPINCGATFYEPRALPDGGLVLRAYNEQLY